MKLVVLLLIVLALGVFCCAELGEGWDSFESGDDSDSSFVEEPSVGGEVFDDMGVKTGGLNIDSSGSGNVGEYTLEFYIALGVGGVGILIVVIFVYFFLRKPKNRWKRKPIK